jgi:hypothetical protein
VPLLRPLATAASAVVLAMAGTVAAGSGAPAAAAVPGAEFVWPERPPATSEPVKSAAASCPAGKRTIGAFAFTSGNTGDVVITTLLPTSTAVIAIAREDQDGTTDDWQLHVQLICADPLPGLMIVSTSSADNSVDKQVTATCPAGRRLLTAGWHLLDSGGEVFLNQVAQSAALDRVSVTGMEDQDGLAGDWRLATYAVCADPLPGLELRTAVSPTDSSDKSVLLVCADGQRRLSLGWSLIGTGAGTPAGQVLAQPGSSGTNWAQVAAAEDDDGYAGDWYVTGRIVCVTV